jgi:hypothetical protein
VRFGGAVVRCGLVVRFGGAVRLVVVKKKTAMPAFGFVIAYKCLPAD